MALYGKPSKKPADIALALALLQSRIDGGQEFPDACHATAWHQNVDYQALADAYDEACQHARDKRDGYAD